MRIVTQQPRTGRILSLSSTILHHLTSNATRGSRDAKTTVEGVGGGRSLWLCLCFVWLGLVWFSSNQTWLIAQY